MRLVPVVIFVGTTALAILALRSSPFILAAVVALNLIVAIIAWVVLVDRYTALCLVRRDDESGAVSQAPPDRADDPDAHAVSVDERLHATTKLDPTKPGGYPIEPRLEPLTEARIALTAVASPFLRDGDGDLVAAVEHMACIWSAQTGVPYRCEVVGDPGETPADAVLLRAVQEALHNVERYSCAERVVVTLTYLSDLVRVEVLDDGRGFDVTVNRPGRGLNDLRERLHQVDGSLRVDTVPGHGCSLQAVAPRLHSLHAARRGRHGNGVSASSTT